ncbi:hypothetical protein ACFE04_021386 [Oxalis oulophora]
MKKKTSKSGRGIPEPQTMGNKFIDIICGGSYMKSIENNKTSKSGRGTSEPIKSISEKESISKRKSIFKKKRKSIANESISKKKTSKSGRGTSEPIESISEKESISKRKSILRKKRKRIANESISKKKSIAKEESISNLPILPDYFVDADDLKENGVDIGDYVSFFGLEKVLSCKEEICYGELVNEFYDNIKKHSNKEIISKVQKKDITISVKILHAVFGFCCEGFSVENVSSSKVIDGFKAEEFCSEISVQGLSKVAAADLKILPRIWYTILWKILMLVAGSHYKLKTTELQILWHVMKRRPVNFGKLMIAVMRRPIQRGENADKKTEKLKKVPNLPYGSLLTLVFKHFKVNLPDVQIQNFPNPINSSYLKQVAIRTQNGWVPTKHISEEEGSKEKSEQPEVGEGELKTRNKKEKVNVGREEMIHLLLNIVQSLMKRGFDTPNPHHCPEAGVNQNPVEMAKLVDGEGVSNVSTLQGQADFNQNLVDMASVEGDGVTKVSALQVQADGNQNLVDMAEGVTDVSALQEQVLKLTIDPEMEPSDDATNIEDMADKIKISYGNKRDAIMDMNESDEGVTKELFAPVSESMEKELDESNYQQASGGESDALKL